MNSFGRRSDIIAIAAIIVVGVRDIGQVDVITVALGAVTVPYAFRTGSIAVRTDAGTICPPRRLRPCNYQVAMSSSVRIYK